MILEKIHDFLNSMNSDVILNLRKFRRRINHKLKRYPIYRVVDFLKEKNVLHDTITLEVFANRGEHQIPAYFRYARYFEAWEIDPKCEKELRKNLPGATVKITDSFKEALRCNKKFNFIIMDSHMNVFGDAHQYCEHFEILPLVFRLCMDECTLLLNVIPDCDTKWKMKYKSMFDEIHLKRRKEFYHCSDPANISFEFMTDFYTRLCEKNGFKAEWIFYHKRHVLYYCAIRIKKIIQSEQQHPDRTKM